VESETVSLEYLVPRLREASRGCDLIDVFLEERWSYYCIATEAGIKAARQRMERGAGVRALSGEIISYALIRNPSLPLLLISLKRIEKAIRDRKSIFIVLGQYSKAQDWFVCPSKAKEALEKAFAFASQFHPAIVEMEGVSWGFKQKIEILRSDRNLTKDERGFSLLALKAKSRQGGGIGIAVRGAIGHRGHFTEQILKEIGEEAARRAIMKSKAKPIPSGEFTVVITSQDRGAFLHEVIGHYLEADWAQSSGYYNLLGQRVAGPWVTLIDDPTLPKEAPFYCIDDEGTPASKTLLIEKGILRGLLCDLWQARQIHLPPTGNGRRASFRYLPLPRMSHTFLAPGRYIEDEIIRSVKRGILVRSSMGGAANPQTGEFHILVLEGYCIERGQITYPIKSIVLVGNSLNILQNIDMVGNNLSPAHIGLCAKAGQIIPVAFLHPTIRIRVMSLVKEEKAEEMLARRFEHLKRLINLI
jgi:TldD protein